MISVENSPWIPEKGKHLVYATELETRDEDGELVCENQFVTFVRNQGGYGGTNEVSFPIQPSYWLIKTDLKAPIKKTHLSQKQLFNLSKLRIVHQISKLKNLFQKVKQHYTD